MSTRTLFIGLFLCIAIATPWMFTDWLSENLGSPVVVESELQQRNFIRVEDNPVVAVPPLENKATRKLGRAIQNSFQTAANAANNQVVQSRKSEAAKSKHLGRLKQEMTSKGLRFGAPVFCRMFKQEKQFELWVKPDSRAEFSLFKSYPITEFTGNLGPKRKNGDNQSPEGFYFVTPTRMLADHQLHMGFDIGYPNQFDAHWKRDGARAFVNGANKAKNSFALSNQAMEEVFLIMANAMDNGQNYVRIHSFPFRMADSGLSKRLQGHPRNDFFWANLKEGYDFFEILRRPPNVTVSGKGKYQFSLP